MAYIMFYYNFVLAIIKNNAVRTLLFARYHQKTRKQIQQETIITNKRTRNYYNKQANEKLL